MKKQDINLHKIKVNVNSNGYWFVPSSIKLFTPHSKDHVIKNSKNLSDIIKYNQLVFGNYYFSFNKDHDFKAFNQLQQLSEFKHIRITKKEINEIEQNKAIYFDIDDNIKIKLNEKSLYYIFSGYSFFVDKNYFNNLVNYYKLINNKENENQNLWIFSWNKKEFILEKE